MSMKIAILGAESTGKTQLAQALAAAMHTDQTPTTWVPEYLREWCDAKGRTPAKEEQRGIAFAQEQRAEQGPANTTRICESTALTTAVYSDLFFGDRTLYPMALACQQGYALTLVTGLDLPWVADGLQRDGPQARSRFDALLRTVLQDHKLVFSLVYGSGEARTQAALRAIRHHQGSLTAAVRPGPAWRWNCEKCSEPQCEHQLFRHMLDTQPP